MSPLPNFKSLRKSGLIVSCLFVMSCIQNPEYCNQSVYQDQQSGFVMRMNKDSVELLSLNLYSKILLSRKEDALFCDFNSMDQQIYFDTLYGNKRKQSLFVGNVQKSPSNCRINFEYGPAQTLHFNKTKAGKSPETIIISTYSNMRKRGTIVIENKNNDPMFLIVKHLIECNTTPYTLVDTHGEDLAYIISTGPSSLTDTLRFLPRFISDLIPESF